MHYIKSRNNRTYQASVDNKQVVIPRYSDTTWLVLGDSEYKALLKYPTIKGLIDCGAILDSEIEPDDLKNSPDALLQSRKDLENKVHLLEAQLEASDVGAVQKELDEVKAEAIETINAKNKEIEELKAKLASLEVSSQEGPQEELVDEASSSPKKGKK